MKMPIRLAAAAVLVSGALALSGCPFSTSPNKGGQEPPLDPFLARTSPQNLLLNLKTAYRLREVAPYESLLARDFEFYFSEEDVQIAEKLSRDEEIEVHRRMFSDTRVTSLSLEFSPADVTQDMNKPDPKYPDRFLWTMTLTNVDLRLSLTDEGEPVVYELNDGSEQYWFREEPWTDPKDGNPVWSIVQWKELSIETP